MYQIMPNLKCQDLESDRNFKAPIVIMFNDITLAINEK